MELERVELSVTDFVSLFNQTMDLAYSDVVITGELANLRVSRNKWIYFDLKDEYSSVKFFGTVYQLPGPLEDGMLVKVKGQPRLHNQYGFSVNVLSIQPSGEGSIKKAANLLKQQLEKEGLFDESRKRSLVYPPETIGLITSKQSAAYADFIKILNARWAGLNVELIDVQVQGEVAPGQIIGAINQFNAAAEPPDIIVLIRGGGSAEDLMAFSTEEVTRAVASSRVPTIVAIGHEVDLSLAELASDKRASTPSNAAELLVPDKKDQLAQLEALKTDLRKITLNCISSSRIELKQAQNLFSAALNTSLTNAYLNLASKTSLLKAFNPEAVLKRGYAIVRNSKNQVLRSTDNLNVGELIKVKVSAGEFKAKVEEL